MGSGTVALSAQERPKDHGGGGGLKQQADSKTWGHLDCLVLIYMGIV